jgi:hypothetical protein
MEINEKYVKQTLDAMADNRMTTGVVAQQIAQFKPREQIRFFKLAINYIEILAQHGERGYTLLGLEHIVKACGELMFVVDSHFPKEEMQMALPGMEYIAV